MPLLKNLNSSCLKQPHIFFFFYISSTLLFMNSCLSRQPLILDTILFTNSGKLCTHPSLLSTMIQLFIDQYINLSSYLLRIWRLSQTDRLTLRLTPLEFQAVFLHCLQYFQKRRLPADPYGYYNLLNYEVCPEHIQPFWTSQKPVVGLWSNLVTIQ